MSTHKILDPMASDHPAVRANEEEPLSWWLLLLLLQHHRGMSTFNACFATQHSGRFEEMIIIIITHKNLTVELTIMGTQRERAPVCARRGCRWATEPSVGELGTGIWAGGRGGRPPERATLLPSYDPVKLSQYIEEKERNPRWYYIYTKKGSFFPSSSIHIKKGIQSKNHF